MDAERHPDGIVRVRAPNPSPMTLDGTNTYVAAGWAIDPGPADEGHLEAVLAAAGGRLDGVLLTHTHPDHSDGAERLAELAGGVAVILPDRDGPAGPFEAVLTPGHAPDHVCLLLGGACFAGDLVMGTGSVFIMPGEGSLFGLSRLAPPHPRARPRRPLSRPRPLRLGPRRQARRVRRPPARTRAPAARSPRRRRPRHRRPARPRLGRRASRSCDRSRRSACAPIWRSWARRGAFPRIR